MKVVIKGKVYDPIDEPFMIIFNDDKERLAVCKDISDMPAKEGERGYVVAPEDGKTNTEDFQKYLNVKKVNTRKF